MSCKECDNRTDSLRVTPLYFFRWGAAEVVIVGCPDHVSEVMRALREAQAKAEWLRNNPSSNPRYTVERVELRNRMNKALDTLGKLDGMRAVKGATVNKDGTVHLEQGDYSLDTLEALTLLLTP